ncbi:hypothetical protein FA95DRAFT_1013814 [Auriscalpium vulgare]|uniref:Uncharacterized protein n=1 Tax=Auriscalpium vulgare TaxID=40419 RepID=A0ACB8R7D9_9AGAM|nr:hypothetical protein FA95DRAFT_1013814 [Auriscalpium vulgare]
MNGGEFNKHLLGRHRLGRKSSTFAASTCAIRTFFSFHRLATSPFQSDNSPLQVPDLPVSILASLSPVSYPQ